MDRRKFIQASSLALGSTAGVTLPSSAGMPVNQRPIPSSGEKLPVVGLGTWQTFDVGADKAARNELKYVLAKLVASGGSVVDSSPMYGRSESVLGELSSELNIAPKLFKATKVWTMGRDAGIQQMQESMQKMQTEKMDLMQVHNLLDADTHLKTLAAWKDQGLVRYTGITHYHSGGYAEMKRLMLNHKLDFIQINYSILNREAEKEILPLAQDRGIAVLINRPFESGRVFNSVANRELPSWAKEFGCESWGQFFLKFILANKGVSCVIPGTSKSKHMMDNVQAGKGRTPNAKEVAEMLKVISS